jgi:aminoglycoside phosphotransferase (APT) family kinase protein
VAHLDGNLVVRVAQGGGAARQVEREAALLVLLAEVVSVPVPRPVRVEPERGRMAYVRLPGTPLVDLPHRLQERAAEPVARQLGHMLRALHDVEHATVEAMVDVDHDDPAAWLDETARHYELASTSIPDGYKNSIESFLAAAPPAGPDRLVFSHNDLGIEHVLVDPATLTVTGVIDWSDAAITDPARDFGLLLRDLGDHALTSALAAYGPSHEPDALVRRARFHARCSLFEDLAYGLANNRPEYVTKSLAGLAWLFV